MKQKGLYQPPRLALRLFQWYCRDDRLEELQGDLEEFFYLRLTRGEPLWRARLFFYWNVLRCYRAYAKPKTQKTMTIIPLFKSYFKLALRHSWKNKWSVLINVVGLGLALSMCIFLYTVYAYNLEFDNYYNDTDEIYRVHSMTTENGLEKRNEITPTPLDYVLRNQLSSVEQVAFYRDIHLNVKKGTDYFTESVAFVSGDFFDMFNHELWYGSFSNFSEQPVAYLTQQAAEKYFGKEAAIDQQLTLYLNDEQKIDVVIAGVFDRIPENSSFDGQIFVNHKHYANATALNMNDWKEIKYVAHYIRTQPAFLPSITDQLNEYIPQQNESHEELPITSFELVPFDSPLVAQDILWRRYVNARLRPEVMIIFTTLIIMIFLIACFNLANTSMAMISKRLKEIGVRKTLGSGNKLIMAQFLLEMGVIASLAFIIAVSTSNTVSRIILGMFGGDFLLKDASLSGVIAFVAVFLLFTTLVAGLLPALYAYRFQPVEIMRKTVRLKGVSWLNKGLTVIQFAFSIAVLTAGIAFSQNRVFLDTMT